MTKSKKTSDDAQPRASKTNDELIALARAFRKSKNRSPAARRKLVAALRAVGRSDPEIAEELKSTVKTVRRDIAELRRRAAERQLATNPEACAPLFLEEAESVVRKVREAQHAQGLKKDGTFYLNLLKLEWTMLVKLVEMTRPQAANKSDPANDEDDDLSNCTNQELLQKARELGIDVSGFERALRLLPHEAP
ncbi:MAG: hypothetical protein ABIF82_03755 [Planctomycetota bacterium]